jgi:hypothetical protein
MFFFVHFLNTYPVPCTNFILKLFVEKKNPREIILLHKKGKKEEDSDLNGKMWIDTLP